MRCAGPQTGVRFSSDASQQPSLALPTSPQPLKRTRRCPDHEVSGKGLGHVTEINGGHRSEWGAGYVRCLGRLVWGSGAFRPVSRPCVACVSAPQGPERARSRARCVPSLSRQFVEINVSTSLWVQGFRRGYSAASLVFKGVFMTQNTGVPTFSGREAGYLVGAL